MQQIQRGKKISMPVAAGPAIKADTKPEKAILSHPKQATEHYMTISCQRCIMSMIHHKCSTMEKPKAMMSTQSHPEKEIVF